MKLKSLIQQRFHTNYILNKLSERLFEYDFVGVRWHLIMISNTSDFLYNPTVMRLYNSLSVFHLKWKLRKVDFPEVD